MIEESELLTVSFISNDNEYFNGELIITASKLEDIKKINPEATILVICLEEEGKNPQFFPGTQASVSN